MSQPAKIDDRFLVETDYIKDLRPGVPRIFPVGAMRVDLLGICTLDSYAKALVGPLPESWIVVMRADSGFEVGMQRVRGGSWERQPSRISIPGEVERIPVSGFIEGVKGEHLAWHMARQFD